MEGEASLLTLGSHSPRCRCAGRKCWKGTGASSSSSSSSSCSFVNKHITHHSVCRREVSSVHSEDTRALWGKQATFHFFFQLRAFQTLQVNKCSSSQWLDVRVWCLCSHMGQLSSCLGRFTLWGVCRGMGVGLRVTLAPDFPRV